MPRITVSLDPELAADYPGRRAAKVTVKLRDGRELFRYQPTRKGDPDAPLSDTRALGEVHRARGARDRRRRRRGRCWRRSGTATPCPARCRSSPTAERAAPPSSEEPGSVPDTFRGCDKDQGPAAMTEGPDSPPGDDAAEEGIPLIEGWMLGRLLFPLAMEELQRVPPANDDEQGE